MALGKGLGALIATSASRRTLKKGQIDDQDGQKIWNIPVSSVGPNPDQPRKYFNPRELDELATSIKEHGVLQPVLVSEKIDGGYELISGERRWRASQIAGLLEIPVVIKKLADQQKLEVALIENIQREDLTPLEEAFAYSRLSEEFGLSQQEISAKVGKTPSTISNSIRLLGLPEEIKEALTEKKISMGQARALLGLKDKQQQLEMLSSLMGKSITVREVERAVGNKVANSKKHGNRRDPNLIYLEDKLRTALGTKVLITQKANKGKIMIEYYSKEELGDLIKKLAG
ncbi:MAG: ParB/RepB/Spo0J family partition protein [bacterium]